MTERFVLVATLVVMVCFGLLIYDLHFRRMQDRQLMDVQYALAYSRHAELLDRINRLEAELNRPRL